MGNYCVWLSFLLFVVLFCCDFITHEFGNFRRLMGLDEFDYELNKNYMWQKKTNT